MTDPRPADRRDPLPHIERQHAAVLRFQSKHLRGDPKLTLIWLREQCPEVGRPFFVGQSDLKRAFGISETSMDRHFKALQKAGWLEWQRAPVGYQVTLSAEVPTDASTHASADASTHPLTHPPKLAIAGHSSKKSAAQTEAPIDNAAWLRKRAKSEARDVLVRTYVQPRSQVEALASVHPVHERTGFECSESTPRAEAAVLSRAELIWRKLGADPTLYRFQPILVAWSIERGRIAEAAAAELVDYCNRTVREGKGKRGNTASMIFASQLERVLGDAYRTILQLRAELKAAGIAWRHDWSNPARAPPCAK